MISTTMMGMKITVANICNMDIKDMATSLATTILMSAGKVKGASADVITTTTRTSALLPRTMFEIMGATTPAETPVKSRAERAISSRINKRQNT